MLKVLLKGIHRVEQTFDNARWAYIRKFNRLGPVKIEPYRGFGDQEKAYINGRLLEVRNLPDPREQDTIWQNVKAMYKRFMTREVPGALLQAEFMGKRYEGYTDEEGYFEFHMEVNDQYDPEAIWQEANFSLLDKIGRNPGPVTAVGQIKIPPTVAEFGVISDIDDTIIRTEATSFVRMMKNTFTRNAVTRLPFEGVAGFYRALHMGSKKDRYKNPIYYVSSSPWNLFDMLEDFLEVNEIPAGPLMLRDFGIDDTKFIKTGHLQHKLEQIEKIISFSGDMPFILIGDSGQKDPEIYERVVKDFPGRIKAIYIRDVSRKKRDVQVVKIGQTLTAAGVEMLFVPDTEIAARHALEKGYILQEYMKDIIIEKAKDEDTL
jgi:phosphatidate phosphatase APP1